MFEVLLTFVRLGVHFHNVYLIKLVIFVIPRVNKSNRIRSEQLGHWRKSKLLLVGAYIILPLKQNCSTLKSRVLSLIVLTMTLADIRIAPGC